MTFSPATPPDAALPDNSICPACGAGLRCGMVAGDAECWCMQSPHHLPVPVSNTTMNEADAPRCYCPACLKKIADDRRGPHSPSSG